MGNSKSINLPQKAEVIVHEIIGNDPFQENILIYLADAKKRFLDRKGTLIPYRLQISCLAFQEEMNNTIENEAIELGRLYGLNFNAYSRILKNTKGTHKLVDSSLDNSQLLSRKIILSEETILYDIDFYDDFLAKIQMQKQVNLEINKNGVLSGIIVYFKAFLTEKIILSNSPFGPQTSWEQKIFLFPGGKKVKEGSDILLDVGIKNVHGLQAINVEIAR